MDYDAGMSNASQPNVKTLVWGYTYEFAPIIDYLKDQGVCDVREWIGTEKRCTYSRKNFMERDMSFPFQSPVRCPDYLYDEVAKDFRTYLEMANRRNHFVNYYAYTIYDFFNLFHQQLDYFYHLLSSNKIELVMIDTITHYGEDRILYTLAKAMGIDTILIFPTLFQERFFYVFDVNDFGHFSQLPQLEEPEPGRIDTNKKLGQYLGYLKQYKPPTYNLLDASKEFFNGKPYAFTKYAKYKKFKQNLKKVTVNSVDFNTPFVYFPLHLQPEMSSCPLGDKYVDQLLALETLAEILPDGWKIYAKENVHQTEFMRGEIFYNRLKKIDKLVVVPSHLSSPELIEKSQFTATITGTAGWEAINAGKKVLAFGRPWYLTLSGVSYYRPGITVEEVLNNHFTDDDLQESLRVLLSKAGRGETSRLYTKKGDFDEKANAQKVGESFTKAIYHLQRLKHREAIT